MKTKGSGLKFDQKKNRWDLLPYKAVEFVVKALTHGADKYGDLNWMNVSEPRKRYFAAAMRHLVAWKTGTKIDKDSGLPHLACAITNLLFLLEMDEQKKLVDTLRFKW